MKKRRLLTILFSILALSVLVVPVLAGGWAVFTLEELPTNIVAGEPVTFHYTIRQHGKNPLTVEASYLVARQPESGESLSVLAQSGKTGEYSATLTFPVAGTWEWSVDGFGRQTWPDLTVLDAKTSTSAAVSTSPPVFSSGLFVMSWVGLLIAALAALYAALSRRRWVMGLVVASLLVSVAGFTSTGLRTSAQAKSSAQLPTSQADLQVGQALFVAKGCVTCHQNGNIERRYRENVVAIGVDLTNYPTTLEYLRMWLKDPGSIKPNTAMPNLNLDQAEIEALAAFLLAGSGK